MTISREGSRDVLKLSEEKRLLGASLWGARGICKGGIAKSYLWGLAKGGHCCSLYPYYSMQ